MKRIALSAALIAFVLTLVTAQEQVYICNGSSSTKYHATQTCPGLGRCNGSIEKLPLKTARSMGRSACAKCCDKQQAPLPAGKGMPADAVAGNKNIELPLTAAGRDSQIIRHIGYTTDFNAGWRTPNWVAYDLTKQETKGHNPRPNREFEPDPQVEGSTVVHKDYTHSGYSRGHMAPAADMKWSKQAMNESFYLSNICPQKAELNDEVWKRLEERTRALATESTVYICCGPITGKRPVRIGANKVAVPEKFFKVLCMKRKGEWQAIGFVFPNSACKGSMFDYALPVDEVERLTGHDFFHNLPDSIENRVEAVWRMRDWQ